MELFSTISRGWGILVCMSIVSVIQVHGYSNSEESALATFRSRVNGILTQDWMNTNAFLIRWLRQNNLNVGEAEGELKTYLEAREKEGVDNFRPEDFRGMAKIMQFRMEGVDKQGRPIVELFGGKAELRRLALAGKSDLAHKYLIFNFDKALRKTIEIAETTGKDIDCFYLIANADGFNARNHLCVSCFPIVVRIIQVYNSISGHFAKNTTIIEAPRIFTPVATALKQILRGKILDNLVIYNTNKENWQKALSEDIDADQLPPRLGGSNTQFDQKRFAKTNRFFSVDSLY